MENVIPKAPQKNPERSWPLLSGLFKIASARAGAAAQQQFALKSFLGRFSLLTVPLIFAAGCTEAGLELIASLEARDVKNKAIEKRITCYGSKSEALDPSVWTHDWRNNGDGCYLFETAALITDKCLAIREKEPILQEDCELFLWRIVMKPDSLFSRNPGGDPEDEDESRFFLTAKTDADNDPLNQFVYSFQTGRANADERKNWLLKIAKDPVLANGVRYSDIRSPFFRIMYYFFRFVAGQINPTGTTEAAVITALLSKLQADDLDSGTGGTSGDQRFIDVALKELKGIADDTELNKKAGALKWVNDIIANNCRFKGAAALRYTTGAGTKEARCHIRHYCEMGFFAGTSSDGYATAQEVNDIFLRLKFFQEPLNLILKDSNLRPNSNPPDWWTTTAETGVTSQGVDGATSALPIKWKKDLDSTTTNNLCNTAAVAWQTS